MQYYWLNRQNNENLAVGRHCNADNRQKKLIVFFAGWSFDYKPFEFLDCEDFDVLFVYDYNDFCHSEAENFIRSFASLRMTTAEESHKYNKKNLISWSMGSFVAYQMRDLFKGFDKKIAINGTPFPVDNEYGIPEKPFLLTLRHAKTGLEGKFYQNIFEKEEEYERYLKNPVERSIENRVEELQNLYENIQETSKTYENFFDKAFVSLSDKIIPSKNQLKFWNDFNVLVETLDSGHFPYYNFSSWKEFL